jgi:hypothetical protein
MIGIDLSQWNDDSWRYIKDIKFAYIRTSQGTGIIDHSYPHHREVADDLNVVSGPYQFFDARVSGVEQANIMLELAHLRPKDLVPAIDLEMSFGCSAHQIATELTLFIDTVKRAVKTNPVIYTNKNFWTTHMNDTTQFSDLLLWVAAWGAKYPEMFGGWNAYYMHQYESEKFDYDFCRTLKTCGSAAEKPIKKTSVLLAQYHTYVCEHLPHPVLSYENYITRVYDGEFYAQFKKSHPHNTITEAEFLKKEGLPSSTNTVIKPNK